MFVNIESLGWVRAQLGVRKMARLIDRHIVSRYALSLTPQDREQYRSKIVLANGDCLPDPELLTEWVDNVIKWPDIHWPAIYCYLVDKPSVYTREKLRAYKSLDAYNYVVCGHVQTVLYSDIGDDFCVLKAEVLPSQRQGKNTSMYQAWVVINKREGYIHNANCTCMAG